MDRNDEWGFIAYMDIMEDERLKAERVAKIHADFIFTDFMLKMESQRIRDLGPIRSLRR